MNELQNMGKNCSVLKKTYEQILKCIKQCAKIDRHQRRCLNLVGELLQGILRSLHSGTSASRKANLLPVPLQSDFNYRSRTPQMLTGTENGPQASNKQKSFSIGKRECKSMSSSQSRGEG